MKELLAFIVENVGSVIAGVVTTGIITLSAYIYRTGSWTKDHQRARLFEDRGDKLLESNLTTAAIEQYKEANKIWEAEVNQTRMLAIYHKIGKAYRRLNDTERALEALTHCEMLWEALKKDVKIYDIYFELSHVHLTQRNLVRADHYIALSIKMLRVQRSPRLPVALSLSARIAKERGRPEQAESEYIEAINVLDDISDTLGLASVYYELGDLKSSQLQRDLAVGYYAKSAEAYEKLGSARAGEIRAKVNALQAA